ncbi:MAG TPA: hypothetical protein VJ952_08515 [Opitutales bacterium]|nr:hypothetical protein [Opitutales bacterium]
MDKDKLLEELRAQRELIRQHLQWLDQKIGSLEKDGGPDSISPGEEITEPPTDSPETVAKPALREPPSADSGPESAKEFTSYKAAGGSDLTRVKVGCLILLVLGAMLFLFILFGLPYLIY